MSRCRHAFAHVRAFCKVRTNQCNVNGEEGRDPWSVLSSIHLYGNNQNPYIRKNWIKTGSGNQLQRPERCTSRLLFRKWNQIEGSRELEPRIQWNGKKAIFYSCQQIKDFQNGITLLYGNMTDRYCFTPNSTLWCFKIFQTWMMK